MPEAYSQPASAPWLTLADGRLQVDPDGSAARLDGEALGLTGRQLALLQRFASMPDTYLSVGQLAVSESGVSESVQERISALRKALGPAGLGDPRKGVIRTAAELGYMALSSLDPGNVGAILRPGEEVHTFGDESVQVLPERKLVRVSGQWVEIHGWAPYTILAALAAACPNHLTYADLAATLSQTDDKNTRASLHNMIGQLRKAVRDPLLIRSIYGVGYRAVKSRRW